MGHITRTPVWGSIDLDTTEGRVYFKQKWLYHWSLWPGVTDVWTYKEKLRFHTRVDISIWRVWSNKLKLTVAGAAPFAAKFAATGVPINFDVEWILSGTPHYTVTVFKMPAGSTATTHRSNVNFGARTIELDTADVGTHAVANAAGATNPNFETPPHEFSHTLNNPDEYNAGSPHIADSSSLVNIGNQVRARHIRLILAELNTMIPGVTFSL